MKDNICQTQFSAKEQLNNFPSNSAPAESQGQPLINDITYERPLWILERNYCHHICAERNFRLTLIWYPTIVFKESVGCWDELYLANLQNQKLATISK